MYQIEVKGEGSIMQGLGMIENTMIVFGTGKVAEKVILWLEKRGHILFCVDNDQRKWNRTFRKYEVRSPDKIKEYDCDIIVAVSYQYESEIIEQLMRMEVGGDRIHFCRHNLSDGGVYEIYPLDAEKIQGKNIPLIRYDLLHAEEVETGSKKVMIFCSFFSVYTKQLIENMSKRYTDIEFSLLTRDEENCDKIKATMLKHIYCYQTLRDLKTILEQMPVYDAMQLLWIEQHWVYFYRLIGMKTRKLNLNVGGSDFYRAGSEEREFKRKIIEKADCITAETEQTIQDFKTYYGAVAQKTGLLPFGIEVLDFIKGNAGTSCSSIKKKLGFPADKLIVTCGHNANRAHQHIKIIEALGCLDEYIKKQLMLVFPMTYGQNEGYIKEVSDALEDKGIEYAILTKFMSFQEMAEYALVSDIMIHVQTTDQLSSTMLEEMYAGSIVIAGSWLPYQSLHEMGIYFLDVDTIPDVPETLQKVVLNIEIYKKKCARNKEIIWKHSAWDELAPKWHALWE